MAGEIKQQEKHLETTPPASQTGGADHNYVLERAGLSRKLMLTSLISYLSAFNFGYNNAIVGSTLTQANFYKYFTEIVPTTRHGTILIGTFVGMVSLGGAFGVILNGFVNDRFGRKVGFFTCGLLTILGVAIYGGSRNIGMLMAGRAISGVGAWGGINVAIVYVQELAPTAYRGEFGVGIGPSLNAAYFTAGWIQVGFFYVKNENNWRIPIILGIAWALTLCIAVFFVPESPRYLIWKGREAEALEVFKVFHADPRDPDHLLAREEHYQICQQVALDKTLPSGWGAMFTRYWRRTWASALVTMNNQAGGIQVVTNYGATIYARAGCTGVIPFVVNASWLTWANISAIFWAFQIDRIGRKKLLVFQAVACALGFSIIIGLWAAYFDNAATAKNLHAGQSALIFSFFLYVFVYEMGEPTIFIYIGEIFPMHIRAKGVAVGLCSLNLTAFWVTLAFPLGVAVGGYKFLFLFWGSLICCAVLQQIFLKESRHIPLEEMAVIWGNPDEVAIFSKDIRLDMLSPERQQGVAAGLPPKQHV